VDKKTYTPKYESYEDERQGSSSGRRKGISRKRGRRRRKLIRNAL
jgi:hypothetical protein